MILSRTTSTRNIGLITILCFSFIHFENTLAQESSGAAGTFLRMGVGARALSMGGAFAGIANDPSATFWNPAGLYHIKNYQFEFMYVNMPFDRTFNFFSGVIPVTGFMTFGVSWIGLRIENIEGRNFNSSEPEYLFSNSQNAFFLSFAKSLSSFLSFGGSVKIIQTELDNNNATGLGFDGAVLFKPFDQLSLGMVVQDFGTDLRWNAGYTEGVPLTLRFGVGWQIYGNVLIAADIQKTSKSAPEFHLGGELRLLETIPIRMGFNNQQVTGGIGLLLPLANHNLEINYGYSNDRRVNDAVHRVSLVFSFGSNSSRVFRRANKKRPVDVWDSDNQDFDQAGLYVVVTTRVLNVRSGPGTKSAKIAKILKGQKFKAFETSGNWRRIKLKNGKMGWVHGDYVRIVRSN